MPTRGSTGAGPEETGDVGKVLLGRYRIEKVLGRGGMGEVLLAHDTLLHRKVALKHLRTDGVPGADRRSAILKEARRATQVGDRRIAAIHDVLDLGEDVLIVMEHVEGSTLREHLREPFPLDRFWKLSAECLDALGTAHAHGVIHRDIKPENLMLTSEGEVKILDFGLALRSERQVGPVVAEGSTVTAEAYHRPAGTPPYMAPEAHYGGHIDERTDLFSLGAVFYEMLTARHPFAATGYESVLDAIMNRVPAAVSSLNPAVSPALSDVVARMLARDPAQRYASCEEVSTALEQARSTPVEPAAVPVRMLGPPNRPRIRGLHVVLVTAAAVAVGLLAWLKLVTPRLPHERNVVVLLPEAPGASADFAAFSLGAIALLATSLQRHQDEPHFQSAPFREAYAEDVRTPEDARKLLGANLALRSTFEQTPTAFRARIELRDPVRSRLLEARRFEVPIGEAGAFVDSLYRQCATLLRLTPRRDLVTRALGVRGAGTMRFLVQGIGRARQADSEAELRRARQELEMACRAEPGAAQPRAWLSYANHRSYRVLDDPAWLGPAEDVARQAVALDDGDAEAHRALAEALAGRKRHAEALGEFRRASELQPERDDLVFYLGAAQARVGNKAGERDVYAAAIARRPHAFRPKWWLADCEFRQGRVADATRTYAEMIRCAPELSKGYSSLGGLLVLQGEYARAIDTLRLAVRLCPTAPAFSNLGTAYFNTGRFDESVEAYNQALQFDNENEVMWLNLGEAYYWLRDRPDQAREAFEQAVRLGRQSIQEHVASGVEPSAGELATLANVFPKLEQPDSARAWIERALARDSTNSMVQYSAALTWWQLGERTRALEWLERSVAAGYPTTWLRDSPVHRDWRSEPRFNALLAHATAASRSTPSPANGVRR